MHPSNCRLQVQCTCQRLSAKVHQRQLPLLIELAHLSNMAHKMSLFQKSCQGDLLKQRWMDIGKEAGSDERFDQIRGTTR